MDLYAYVLEQLRQDDCRRLRTYVADGRSEFSTWLVVVAQRLCLDHRRQRFGRFRAQPDQADAREEHAARRRLVNLIGAEIDLSALADQHRIGADESVHLDDIHRALQSALQQLGPRDRLLIKLRFEDALPMPEVAQSLGLPTRFHAYRRLTEVLGLLREAMQRSGFREGSP
jgi:RNA polymerase sigma factor (sigma-70 family)